MGAGGGATGGRGSSVAARHDLVVVGGGPAGSTAAAIAARRGLDVLLLEADRHPRVHVGESLLPGIAPILDEMGVLDAVEEAGFGLKTGTTHWKWGLSRAWDLWFKDTDQYDHAWLVDRSRFDEILFRAAARAGARTLEQAAVRELLWDGERLRGVRYRRRGSSSLEEVEAHTVIDASGQAALIARELELRSHIGGLKHQASWAHYEGAGRLPAPREHQALFVAEDRYWLWLFPLDEERASVGLIRLDDGASGTARETAFERAVQSSEEFMGVLGSRARRVTPVRHQRDWSYRVARVAGPGWLVAGDASGFIDPVLSTGVFLAMHAAHHAAVVACEARGDPASEARLLGEYQAHHRELFGDLLRMVRFYYQQHLSKEDYFWESKQILFNKETELKPQKAFLVLTSGLVKNLALDDKQTVVNERRARFAASGAEEIATHDPEQLGFVCFHVQFSPPGEEPAQLYVLFEPRDPAAPTMFRTANLDVNCMAPRFDNDPLGEPRLEPHLRRLQRRLGELDTVSGESLAVFWRRARGELLEAFRALPASFQLVRIFGE